jgi:cell fate regulator YaaT (PSP1 superfamily)
MTTGNPIFRGCPTNKQSGTCAKLHVYDWLSDVPNTANPEEIVEIRFKNTRKDYYRNVNGLKLELGELVAVEASPGHDIGMVSLTGDLVIKQMKRHKVTMLNGELRKVYRKAKPVDAEKWQQAMQREHETMIKSRQITTDLGLNMKIGDVEYQGDGTKAIFYYIADDRVDFRSLIKVLADTFRIRIEMKQIGARQEAGRIGGIGPCGRELCCCSWMSSFSSVTTTAARYQDISLNPQKLAGQCSKLKCCLNYEVDAYIDEQRDFPPTSVQLYTEDGAYNYLKSDIFKRIFWYALSGPTPSGMVPVPVERVREVISMNRNGKKPVKLMELDSDGRPTTPKGGEYDDILGQDSLTRFDKPKSDKNKRRKGAKSKGRDNQVRSNDPQPVPTNLAQQATEGIQTEQQGAQNNGNSNRPDRSNRNARNENRPRPNRDGNKEGNKEGNREGNRDNRENRENREGNRNENREQNREQINRKPGEKLKFEKQPRNPAEGNADSNKANGSEGPREPQNREPQNRNSKRPRPNLRTETGESKPETNNNSNTNETP